MGFAPDLSNFARIGAGMLDAWRESNRQAEIANKIRLIEAIGGDHGVSLASRAYRMAMAEKVMEELAE